MDRQELRKSIYTSLKIGGSRIAAAMTPDERSQRSKKAAETRWRGHVPKRAFTPAVVSRKWSVGAMEMGAKYEAERLAASAKAAEPEMTKLITDIVSANGGRMEGLEHRLKETERLAEKIRDKAKQRNQSLRESASEVVDALRYTGIIDEPPPGMYASTIRGIITTIEEAGMEVAELETHWRRGDGYNGVHLIARHPNGTKVEIQFHTAESLAAKKITHKIYEEARKDGVPPLERARMIRQMVKIADRAPIPKGALGIGVRVFRPPVVEV